MNNEIIKNENIHSELLENKLWEVINNIMWNNNEFSD